MKPDWQLAKTGAPSACKNRCTPFPQIPEPVSADSGTWNPECRARTYHISLFRGRRVLRTTENRPAMLYCTVVSGFGIRIRNPDVCGNGLGRSGLAPAFRHTPKPPPSTLQGFAGCTRNAAAGSRGPPEATGAPGQASRLGLWEAHARPRPPPARG